MELDGNGLEVLGRSACLDLLGSASIGRVALCIDALPVVLPVTFSVHDRDLVICAMGGRRIASALDDTVVAFQADGHSQETGLGWSVLVQGAVRVVPDPSSLPVARRPARRIWGAASEDQFAAIRTDLVCGRRVP
jgi:nitroimidazol reductase NimA-like FMN-containing flavoprotein (pyridoxamine 5'-phosphate oxidase superfamily)